MGLPSDQGGWFVQYVSQDEWVRLTRDYTVVGAATGSNQLVREAVGRCLWDAFPTADKVFKPFYEQAWSDARLPLVRLDRLP